MTFRNKNNNNSTYNNTNKTFRNSNHVNSLQIGGGDKTENAKEPEKNNKIVKDLPRKEILYYDNNNELYNIITKDLKSKLKSELKFQKYIDNKRFKSTRKAARKIRLHIKKKKTIERIKEDILLNDKYNNNQDVKKKYN